MIIIAIIMISNFMIIVDANFLSCIHNVFIKSDAVSDFDCILDQ